MAASDTRRWVHRAWRQKGQAGGQPGQPVGRSARPACLPGQAGGQACRAVGWSSPAGIAWPPPSDGLRGRRLPEALPWASKRLPRARQASHDKQCLPPQTRFPCRRNAMLGRRFCRSRGQKEFTSSKTALSCTQNVASDGKLASRLHETLGFENAPRAGTLAPHSLPFNFCAQGSGI